MAGLSPRAKSRVYANLEKYARSGMGMEKACDSLLGQPRLKPEERRIYRGILRGLNAGRSIGASLGDSGGVISSLECEVVSAAESGGRLDKGFAHLAEYFRRLAQTRRRILKGLAYPVILLHLAIPVSTLAVTAFESFDLEGSGSGPNFGESFAAMGTNMLIAYGAVLLLLLAAAALNRLARHSGAIDGFINRLPLLGKARRAVAMERFSQVFEIFLLSGRMMSDSLAGAGAASGSGLIREAGLRGAKVVAGGDSLATAIYASPRAFPDDFQRGIAVAEESGQLDRELASWGQYYADEATAAMEQLAEWTPRLFYWGIVFFVAFLIIRAALAYRDLLTNLINFSY